MALTGNVTWTHQQVSDTEFDDVKITHVDGTEETVQTPKIIYRIETYNEVYVYVKQIGVHTSTAQGIKQEHVHFHFAGYASKEARDADNEDFLFFSSGHLMEYNCDLNLWSQCYDFLKSREEFSELENC